MPVVATQEYVTHAFCIFLSWNSDKPNRQSGSKHTDRWIPRMHHAINNVVCVFAKRPDKAGIANDVFALLSQTM